MDVAFPLGPWNHWRFWELGTRAAESDSYQQGSLQPIRHPDIHHPGDGTLPWINNILNVFYLYVNIHISLPFETRLDLFILLNGFVNSVASVTHSPPPSLPSRLLPLTTPSEEWFWFWLYSFPIRREAVSESYISSNDFLFWECSHGGAILLIYLIWCAFPESLSLLQNRWEGTARQARALSLLSVETWALYTKPGGRVRLCAATGDAEGLLQQCGVLDIWGACVALLLGPPLWQPPVWSGWREKGHRAVHVLST